MSAADVLPRLLPPTQSGDEGTGSAGADRSCPQPRRTAGAGLTRRARGPVVAIAANLLRRAPGSALRTGFSRRSAITAAGRLG